MVVADVYKNEKGRWQECKGSGRRVFNYFGLAAAAAAARAGVASRFQKSERLGVRG